MKYYLIAKRVPGMVLKTRSILLYCQAAIIGIL